MEPLGSPASPLVVQPNKLLLENGTDQILLEDGTSFLLLEA